MINVEISKIADEMMPYEFRINKKRPYFAYTLPRTKLNEIYFLIKQENVEKEDIHYYVVSKENNVVGRFDIGYTLEDKSAGITYHLVEQFQNRGIGQTTLKFIIDDIFGGLEVDRIIILAVNDRSKAIAVKNGFLKKKANTERTFVLTREQWLACQKDMNQDIDGSR